jgi:transposase
MPPGDTPATTTSRGHTTADVARRYRVSEEKVRGWIRRGELFAIDTSDARCRRPRYVIPPDALERFERGRSAAEPPKPPRRRMETQEIDYYPD